MTRDEAIAILEMDREDAIQAILILAEKAENYDRLCDKPSPTTPSGMTPPYLKPAGKRKRRPCGRKHGHKGISRKRPEKITAYQTHTLKSCPDCHQPLQNPVRTYKRYIEDIPQIDPVVTEHTVHGSWCSCCRKIVQPTVTDALPNARLGLRLVVFTAWLHYLVGISINNIVKMVSVFFNFHISAGGLTQAWKSLATLLESRYNDIGQKVSASAVLHADETGWRLNGKTHWLWCFTTKTLCYYLITRNRGSPVIEKFLGRLFKGILICDFWGAYNKINALAKQRCFYHLFTELVKVDTYNRSIPWKAFRKKLSRVLKDALRLSEEKNHLSPECFLRLKKRLHYRLEQFLITPYQDKDAQRLIKRLNRHKEELFTFLEHEGVSPYNNHAEQQMRKPVLTRKISQQNRSAQGANTQAILMTLLRSAELQGANPVENLLAIAKNALTVKTPSGLAYKIAC
ncbi:IS66 family transposase [Candidatus Brocadia sinica]|uniref:Transposase IS66 n=1 Tax=Candidatus Brocadia sinica JPN1 TaxID=1197129 RepID=A0ABQ0JU91_9BACT|nr:IS66 family transposase [Candidatus Brocadia sinica]NOG41847.1 IS66 family transposase [Planctomycetota bacterium]GAN32265.1 transposase IS66 [Candidatus Brocadia sinica JPN1]